MGSRLSVMVSPNSESGGRVRPPLHIQCTQGARSDDLFSDLIDATRLLLRVPIAFIYRVSPRGSVYLAWRGFSADAPPPDVLSLRAGANVTDPIVIEDAAEDGRLSGHPLVAGPGGARFCQAAPIVSHDGEVLGALCAMDVSPRLASNSEVTVIKYLAGHAADLMELAELRKLRDETIGVPSNPPQKGSPANPPRGRKPAPRAHCVPFH